MGLEVALLGRFAVAVDGRAVLLRPGRARAVLARLALENGRAVQRESLISALWGDDPPASAVNVVQVAVSTLRRELGAEAVLTDPVGYSLGPARVDLDSFTSEVRIGLRAAEQQDDVATVAALAPAIDRFRTPLEDLGDEPFVEPWRASLTERHLVAIETHTAALIRLGRADTAVHVLLDPVQQHPLREALVEQLILALASTGRETESIAVYDAARRRIADELGVDPGTRLRQAYERIVRQELPPQGTAAVQRIRTGLRSIPPMLVGRESDLADLLRLTERKDAAVIALTGPGGIGKTRLAEALVEALPANAAFVAVTGVTGATALAEAVLAEIVEPRPAGDALDALLGALRTRTGTVLVIDDLAPGPGADEVLSALLARAPGVRLVVTSRLPLRRPDETRFRVSPLSTTRIGAGPSAASRMLADRIARARGRDLGPDTAPLLEEIAELCDGVPLAIELAASSVSVVPLADLPDRLRAGHAASDDRSDRSTSVAAAFTSSITDLPSDSERVLRAAAVFPGAAALGALAAVAALPEPVVESALHELLARGLVREVLAVATVRFRLLGPIRDSVLGQVDGPDLDRLHARFLSHYADRFCGHAWFERSPRRFADALVVEAEIGNVQAALDLATDSDPPLFARMVSRLAWASTVLARGETWRRRRMTALGLPGVPNDDRFDLLTAAAASVDELAEAEALAAGLDAARQGWLAFRQVRAALDRGDVAASGDPAALLAAAAAAERGPAHAFLRARSLDAEQMLALLDGRPDDSVDATDEALVAAVEEEREIEAVLLETVRIEALVIAGRVADAAGDALELLEAVPSAGPWLRGSALSLRGVALLQDGRADLALDAQRTSVGLMLGSPWRIEQLEVLLRWATAAHAVDPSDRGASFALGVWQAAMDRLGLAPWPIERALAEQLVQDELDPAAIRAAEQAVRRLGPARAVEDAMRAVLDGRSFTRPTVGG